MNTVSNLSCVIRIGEQNQLASKHIHANSLKKKEKCCQMYFCFDYLYVVIYFDIFFYFFINLYETLGA